MRGDYREVDALLEPGIDALLMLLPCCQQFADNPSSSDIEICRR